MDYEPVIGLEIHAQLLTRSKIFCSCSTLFGAPPNSNTCPVCLALPGALPVLNREALAMAVKAALALGCRINRSSLFARKNYFYPDLPKGYQISQYDQPLAQQGLFEVLSGKHTGPGNSVEYHLRTFGINRVHLEEDAGKSIHTSGGGSLIDLNRTGVPLIEIVSEPDFRSPREACDFFSLIRRTLVDLGICDGNMEEGSLRCDANVSLRPKGEVRLGTKTEIKNLNSFRFMQRALEYEIERQRRVLSDGGQIAQETRLWNEAEERTLSMRSKEEAHDYRYFPDPDLLPVVISENWLEELTAALPELPEQRRRRFMKAYFLDAEEALMVTQTRAAADYFEEAVRSGASGRQVYNWMSGELTRALKGRNLGFSDSPVEAAQLARLVRLVDAGTISGTMAKEVFEEMLASGKTAEQIVDDRGLRQISDTGELDTIVARVVDGHPDKVSAYREGKEGLLGFFVGLVMRETQGRANPKVVNELLRQRLRSKR